MHVLTTALFFQVAGASDTLITRVVGPELSTLQKVLAVAEIGAVVLAYALIIGLLLAVIKMARAVEAAKDKLDDLRHDIRTLVDSGNRVVESANGVVESVRSTVESVHETVESVHETVEVANHRAQQAVGDLADRVDDFNRTLSLVQAETQEVVIGTLAAIRGVKAGVRAMRKRKKPRRDDVRENGESRLEDTSRPRLKRRVPASH